MVQHRSPNQRPRQQPQYVEPGIAGPSSAPQPDVYRIPRVNQVMNPTGAPPPRKKGGRGPGKRDNKEKPIVSVRCVWSTSRQQFPTRLGSCFVTAGKKAI